MSVPKKREVWAQWTAPEPIKYGKGDGGHCEEVNELGYQCCNIRNGTKYCGVHEAIERRNLLFSSTRGWADGW